MICDQWFFSGLLFLRLSCCARSGVRGRASLASKGFQCQNEGQVFSLTRYVARATKTYFLHARHEQDLQKRDSDENRTIRICATLRICSPPSQCLGSDCESFLKGRGRAGQKIQKLGATAAEQWSNQSQALHAHQRIPQWPLSQTTLS